MTTENVLVIGPTLTDIYFIGEASRLDQTAAVPVVDVKLTAHNFGGAANAASTLARLGANTTFITVLGGDPGGTKAEAELPCANLQLCACKLPQYTHPTKTRIYANRRLVARFDTDTDEPQVQDYIRDKFNWVCQHKPKPDAILISDYGNSVITPDVIGTVLAYAKEHNIPVIADPAVARLQYYRECYALTPSIAQLNAAGVTAQELYKALQPKYLLVTMAEQGALLYDDTLHVREFPALLARHRCSIGAGDAVAAALTYATAEGAPIVDAVKYSMAAGAAAVEAFGAVPVSAHDVMRKTLYYTGPAGKIVGIAEAMRLRQSVALSGQTFGIANGVFDLLHIGHMDMLQKAAKECDFLLVLLNNDDSAEEIKRKPVNDEALRALMLANLPYVNAVTFFATPTPEADIVRLAPDVLIKGPGYTSDIVPGASSVIADGGRFVSTTAQHDISTTAILTEVASRSEQNESSPAAPSSSP